MSGCTICIDRFGTGGMDVDGAIQAWYDEKSFYNYQTKACDAGEMCGHYTQVCL